MNRHIFGRSIMILVLLGGCTNSRALAAGPKRAMGEATMNVQEFVHQVFIEGVPYAEAAKYGSDDVPTLLAMLNEPQEKAHWSNIAVTLGIIGDDRAVDPLINFLEGNGETASREDFAARSSALMSLGYLINTSKNAKALAYLKGHMTPKGWRGSKMVTVGALQASQDARSQQLSTLAILGLALSGDPLAKEALESLQKGMRTEAPSAFARQTDSMVTEALKAHEIIAKEGLKAYYQKAKP